MANTFPWENTCGTYDNTWTAWGITRNAAIVNYEIVKDWSEEMWHIDPDPHVDANWGPGYNTTLDRFWGVYFKTASANFG